MELEYPKDSRGKYKYLEGWNIIKADGQLFRIPQLSKIQDNGLTIKVTANHIFYDLLNDFNEDARADSKTVNEALQIALATNPKFNVLASDLTNINTAYFIRENPVTSIFQKILSRWGGELYRDNFNIAIKSRIGQDTGILISYGKNIKGFEQTLDYSTIATKIMPVGKDGLTIDLVNQGSKYLESPRINDYPFVITRVVEFKDIEDATELKNKALTLWGKIDLPSTNYKVNFVELSETEEYKHLQVLQEVKLGDTVIIRHKEFNIDISAKVIKTKKNVLIGRLEEIELGQFKENIAGHINSLEGKINYTNEVIQDINDDLQGTKTTVFQNNQQISLRADSIENDIDGIGTRLSSAEQKITPESIAFTVTESNTYKEYNSVMNKNPLHVTRSATALNPLDLYNFTSGTLFDVDTLMTVDLGASNIVYIADIQINDEDVIDFDDPVERLEKAEASINVQAGQIALVVKEDGSVDSEALVAAINISSTKIEQTALNIDLSGYVTFTSLSTPGQTSIDGGNIITNTISFNSLADKPFIPSQYTDSEALAAWEASGYATYIDGTGAYIGNIKANQLLIGGANGSISFNNLVDKPFIPSTAGDVGAISSTYIDANGVFTPQVYATNINVSGGKITANQIDVNTLQTQITAVSQFVYFTGNPINGIGNMTGGSYINYLGIVSNYGIYLNAPNVKTQSGTVATQEWVSSNYTARFG